MRSNASGDAPSTVRNRSRALSCPACTTAPVPQQVPRWRLVRVGRNRPEYADKGCSLQERQVQGQARDRAARKTAHEVSSAPGNAAERGLGVRAADRVVYDVRLAFAGEASDGVPQIRPGVVDGVFAPIRRHNAAVSSVKTAAMTRAPAAFAVCTPAVPTPPAAPRTSAVSPGLNAAASFSGMPAGTGRSVTASRQA